VGGREIALIVSRTPYRISLFGGGTDYPAWFQEHGGAVLATTIDKYCYLSCRYLPPFFEHRLRVVYSKIEECNSVAEIKHPAVRAVLEHLQLERGLEIHHDGDLPARSGMGSSSSFTVGLLHALHALMGQMRSRKQLAEEGIFVEQQLLKETVGSQDQILAAYGGFNHVTFMPTGEFAVRPVTVPPARLRELNDRLMLFYTGIKRTASDVARSYADDVDGRRRQLRIIRDMVEEALNILVGTDDLDALGDLLHEGWQVKRSLAKAISNDEVDAMYVSARRAGARGGKLLGAGGGGFMLLYVPDGAQDAVRASLTGLLQVPFRFESRGSDIIFFDHEQDYSEVEAFRSTQDIHSFRELAELQPKTRATAGE
jgi:D-glycero-alpha-D-manno-heptose-7-phosphate kinase